MFGIKRWFDELFDGYLVGESMWRFRIFISKRKGLFWGCKEEELDKFYGVQEQYQQYP